MPGKWAMTTTESTELVLWGIEIVDTAIGSLTTLLQGQTDATSFLLSIATRLANVRTLLAQLLKALEHASPSSASRIDLEAAISSCHYLCEKLLSMAQVATLIRAEDLGSRTALLEKDVPQRDNALQDADKDLRGLQRALTLMIQACDPSQQRAAKFGPPPSGLAQQIQKQGRLAPPVLDTKRRVRLGMLKVAKAVAELYSHRPMSRLAPKCVANRRVAADARRRSQLIDKQIEADAELRRTVCTLPLVGSDEANVVFLEHFITRTLDDTPVPSPASVETIRHNILQHVAPLTDSLVVDEYSDLDEDIRAMAREVNGMLRLQSGSKYDERFAEYLKNLWSNPEVRAAYLETSWTGLEAYGDFVVQAVERAFTPGYRPMAHDHSRFAVWRRFSFLQGTFKVDGLTINFFNTQKNSRKFLGPQHDFPCAMFLVDLADCCRSLPEDHASCAFNHSLAVFESLVRSKRIECKSVILVLYNLQEFRANLAHAPLSKTWFPDFTNTGDAATAIEYVLQKFSAVNEARKEMYVHVGELTDPLVFDFVVAATKDTLLQNALNDGFGRQLGASGVPTVAV